MGKPSDYTLVDVVADVFSGVSTAISKVKDVAHQALNAIKTGLEFVANAVLDLILDALVAAVNLLFQTFKEIMDQLLGITITQSNGLYCLNGFCMGIRKVGLGIELTIGDAKISIDDLFRTNHLNIETLSLRVDSFILGSTFAHVAANLLIPDITKTSQAKGMVGIVTSFALQSIGIALFKYLNTNLSNDEKNNLKMFYIFNGIIGILGGLLSFSNIYFDGEFTLKWAKFIPWIEYIDIGEVSAFQGIVKLLSLLSLSAIGIGLVADPLSQSSSATTISISIITAITMIVGMFFDGFKNDKKNDYPTAVNMAIFNFSHGLLYLFIGMTQFN